MRKSPLLRPAALLLAMLSLSIGWGIRGNFGHEAGAMMPGMLCAVAVCLLSGRQDWRERVLFFGFFGAIGWAYGGSMSYMLTISYTHSGHLPTQIYGFFTVFVIGFLWTSLGGAGTAFPAVADRERLTSIFKPIAWILAAFVLQYFFFSDLVRWYETTMRGLDAAGRDYRQRNPLYWLDSDWVDIWLVTFTLCLHNLWERRFSGFSRLALFASGGAAAGFALQKALEAAGLAAVLASALVHPQGDLAAINPATGQPFDPASLVTNWPQIFFDLQAHLGWIFGLIAGAAVFFFRFGQWSPGASLILHLYMTGFLFFLAGPVLLSNVFSAFGGFRITPPRGDNWAVVLGYLAGVLRYMHANGMPWVARISLLSGVMGGLGFMAAQFVKILCLMPGNPVRTQDPAAIQAWAHWRSANWHSLLAEQGVGLLYGLAIVVPMAVLAARTPIVSNPPRLRKWTESLCAFLILNVLLYINLVKNVADWTREHGGFRSVPLRMKAPLFASLEFSALMWFNLLFLAFAVTTVALLVAHSKRPLALVPRTWVGKGQLFYLLFLWAIVIGNYEKALTAFHEQRLGTEAIILVNALLATWLLLVYVREEDAAPFPVESEIPLQRWVLGGFGAMAVAAFVFAGITHGVYGDRHDGWGGRNLRWGPEADWRVKPILKSREHR